MTTNKISGGTTNLTFIDRASTFFKKPLQKKSLHTSSTVTPAPLTPVPHQGIQASQQNINTCFQAPDTEKLKKFLSAKQLETGTLRPYKNKKDFLETIEIANQLALMQGIFESTLSIPKEQIERQQIAFENTLPIPKEQIERQQIAFEKIVPGLFAPSNERKLGFVKGFMEIVEHEGKATPYPLAIMSKKTQEANQRLEAIFKENKDFHIIDSATYDKSGKPQYMQGNNCLIYAVSQQIFHEHGRDAHTTDLKEDHVPKLVQSYTEIVRQIFDNAHPDRPKGAMLDAHDLNEILLIMADVYRTVFKADLPELNVKCISPLSSEVFSSKSAEANTNQEARHLVIWHRGDHFVGITAATEEPKIPDHPLFKPIEPESLIGIEDEHAQTTQPNEILQTAARFDQSVPGAKPRMAAVNEIERVA